MSTAHDDRRPEDRRPEEIEDDIERTRSQIGGTLDEIERRLSPDRLADQLIDYFRGPNEFGTNLARQIKANPIPVALIGIGVAWLLLAGRDDVRSPRYYGRGPRRIAPLPDEGYPPYPYADEYDEYDEYAAANADAVMGGPYDDPYREYRDPYEEGPYDPGRAAYRDYRGAYEDEDVIVGRPRDVAASGSVYDAPGSVYDEDDEGARRATDPLTTAEPATTRTTTSDEQRPLTGGRTGT